MASRLIPRLPSRSLNITRLSLRLSLFVSITLFHLDNRRYYKRGGMVQCNTIANTKPLIEKNAYNIEKDIAFYVYINWYLSDGVSLRWALLSFYHGLFEVVVPTQSGVLYHLVGESTV